MRNVSNERLFTSFGTKNVESYTMRKVVFTLVCMYCTVCLSFSLVLKHHCLIRHFLPTLYLFNLAVQRSEFPT